MKTTLRAAALAIALGVGIPATIFAHTMPIKKPGTLIDVMCSEGVTDETAAKHTRECGLMDVCVKSGYGIVIDGVFHKFDAEGNKQAEAIFRASKKTDHITAMVEGTLQHEGDITVTKLTAE
jgi:hypothetical protein